MAHIILDYNRPLKDGISVSFKAPCHCAAVDGLCVRYNDGGRLASKVFTFRDTHGNNLTQLGNLFSEGAYVRALLDIVNGYAYIENADTNGYLEEAFGAKQNKLAWVTDEDIDAMFEDSYEGVEDEDPEGDENMPDGPGSTPAVSSTNFFDISADGAVFLKPEYRGAYPELATADGTQFGVSDKGIGKAGSKNSELPRNLVIPDTVKGQTVRSIGIGAFAGNMTIESVVLPTYVTEIPAYCFFYCRNLKEVHSNGWITSIDSYAMHSTAVDAVDFPNVTSIGPYAFAKSRIKAVKFPTLAEMGEGAFSTCMLLQTVDAGMIAAVPDLAFYECYELKEVRSTIGITSVGLLAFCATPKLSTVNLSLEANSIKAYAFLKSGFEYDWSKLPQCEFGTGATSQMINPVDIWSNLTIKECENPIPTLFSQRYEEMKGRPIGTSGKEYGANGCVLFSFIHAYCGLTGQHLNSVDEFESIAASFDADILNQFVNDNSSIIRFGNAFGLTVEYDLQEGNGYNLRTGEDLQRIYDALADGKYVAAVMPDQNVMDLIDQDPSNDYNLLVGHTALIYGVRSDGKLLIAESSGQDPENASRGIKYALRFDQILHTPIVDENGVQIKDGSAYYIISKEDVTMKNVNDKLDALLRNVSFRAESNVLEVEEDAGNVSTAHTVRIPCTSGAKLLVFNADDTVKGADGKTTLGRIKAQSKSSGGAWVLGVLGHCLGQIGYYANRGYLSCKKTVYYNAATDGTESIKSAYTYTEEGTACDNSDGFTFVCYGIKAGRYNWTAYYWDE